MMREGGRVVVVGEAAADSRRWKRGFNSLRYLSIVDRTAVRTWMMDERRGWKKIMDRRSIGSSSCCCCCCTRNDGWDPFLSASSPFHRKS